MFSPLLSFIFWTAKLISRFYLIQFKKNKWYINLCVDDQEKKVVDDYLRDNPDDATILSAWIPEKHVHSYLTTESVPGYVEKDEGEMLVHPHDFQYTDEDYSAANIEKKEEKLKMSKNGQWSLTKKKS